jgi:hypothetical protein
LSSLTDANFLSAIENKEKVTTEQTQPNSDDVNLKSPTPEGVETVVKEKLIYYWSSFDLNVNEWFTEYENTEIFKRRMKLKLGKLLLNHTTFRSKLG